MVIRYAPVGGERPTPLRPDAAAPSAARAGWQAPPPRRRAAVSVLRSLLLRLPAMVLAAALPLAAAFAWLQFAPPRYEATATVFVDTAAGRPARAATTPDPAALDPYVRLAASRPVLDKAMLRDRLAADPAIHTRPTGSAALLAMLVDLVRGNGRSGEDRSGAVLRLLGENVQATAAREANLIEITARSPDAGTAAKLANAVAGALVEEVTTQSTRALGADQVRLTRAGEELRTRLREAEGQLARFRAAGGGVDTAAELGRVRVQATEAKARYDQVMKLLQSGKQVEAIADLVRSPAIDRLRIQYNEAAAQEATFRTSLGPRHPSYLEAQAQVSEKRRLLMEALRLAAAAARADWQSAQGQETALEKRAAPETGGETAPAPDRGRLDELERAVELARIAYDRHLRALGSSEAAIDGTPARLISAAAIPSAPQTASGRTVMQLAMAAAAGLAVLVGLAGIVRDARADPRWRPVLRSGQDDDPPAPLPPLPPEEPAAVRRPPASQQAPPYAPPPAQASLASSPPPSATAAAPVIDSPALAREMAAAVLRQPLQTVLVAADSAADIASLALDIATAAAEENLRVLLIDAGEASPVLSEVLRHALLTGRIRIHGRSRVLAAFEVTPARPIWFVPAEAALASAPPEGGRELGGLAGNFDCIVLAGPAGRTAPGQRALAQAAQIVAIMTMGNGEPDTAGWAGALQVPQASVRPVALATVRPGGVR